MKRLLVLLLALVAASACGLGAGGSSGGKVVVTVSRDFGRSKLAPTKSEGSRDGETVMRLLQRNFTVKTKFGGGFVQEIDGVSGGRAKGRRVDWFYYVNGVEASEGAADRKLAPGDRVWWDHHDWGAAQRVPAVVGAFPEPFQSGLNGKKLPVRLVCMGDAGRSCDEVEQRLQQAGVDALARSSLEQSVGKVLRILVGPWREVRKDIAARQLESGPEASGVFAKPDPSGGRIALLDSRGQVQRTLGAAGGLVAATSATDMEPTWLVTGTDQVGVAAAAAAMTEEQLNDRFALAIEAGKGLPLPIEAP
jgi:hypothetical protein